MKQRAGWMATIVFSLAIVALLISVHQFGYQQGKTDAKKEEIAFEPEALGPDCETIMREYTEESRSFKFWPGQEMAGSEVEWIEDEFDLDFWLDADSTIWVKSAVTETRYLAVGITSDESAPVIIGLADTEAHSTGVQYDGPYCLVYSQIVETLSPGQRAPMIWVSATMPQVKYLDLEP